MDLSAFTAARAAVSGFDNELTEKLRVAQDMMQRVAAVFDELKTTEVTGQDAGGAVTVTVSCLGELRSVHIPPRTMQMLDGAGISTAVREALTQARLAAAAVMQKKMTMVTGEAAVPPDKVVAPTDPLQGLREAVPDGGRGQHG